MNITTDVIFFFFLVAIFLFLFSLIHFYPFWFIIPLSKAKIFKEIPYPLILIRKNGKIIFINKEVEKLTNYTLKNLKDLNIENLITSPTTLDILSKCVTSETKSFSSESTLQSKDGKNIPIFLKASLIYDLLLKKRIVGIVLSFTDLSFEKNAIEKLKKIEQLEVLGLLAGGISHDLNNILTSIIAYISLSKSEENLSSSLKEKLDKIESAAKLIFSLNRQLSLISRGANPVKEYCSIKNLIENSLKLALSGSNVDYKLNVPENIYSIYADPSQLNQVFLNLFVNARQAMEKGGIITINCKNIKINGISWIQIEVIDNGSGIDEEIIDKIFQPFFTTKKKGTGLGLAVVKSIVEKHGGTISVSSKKGIGTTFTLKLPAFNILDNDETSLEMHCIKTEIKRSNSLQGKILVMDDDENIREIILTILKKEGNKVYTVSNGGEAITKYLEHFSKGEPFDLLILDDTIRNGYGAESVIKRIRQINKNVKAILMSAHIESNIIKDYQSYGFIGLLQKPFDSQQLLYVVEKALTKEILPV